MSDNQAKTVGQQILERIKALEGMLRLLTLEKKLEDLEKRINSLTSPERQSEQFSKDLKVKLGQAEGPALSEALDNLEEMTTVKRDKNGKRTFLLHRTTPDFEYEKAAEDNTYETGKDTQWIAEIEAAETQQKDKNPVVSCWIPESSIAGILGAQDNTGTWGELGANPNATKYGIVVKPGKYEIYRELRQ
jgi:hypothetical protein